MRSFASSARSLVLRCLLVLLLASLGSAAFAQTQTRGVSPLTDIRYGQLVGTSFPACNSAHYGMPFTLTTTGLTSFCGPNGWGSYAQLNSTGIQVFTAPVVVSAGAGLFAGTLQDSTSTSNVCTGYENGVEGTYWTGSVSATEAWYWSNSCNGSGANPWSTLTLVHQGSTGALNVSIPYQTALGAGSTAGGAPIVTGQIGSTVIGDVATFAGTSWAIKDSGVQLTQSNIGGDLPASSTGGGNTASGGGALGANTSGNHNTGYGNSVLFDNTTGSWNTACGAQAMLGNTTGSNNTACGYQALAGNATGSDNTAFGYAAGPTGTNLSNTIAIGSGAQVSTSNTIQFGNSFVTAAYIGPNQVCMANGTGCASQVPATDAACLAQAVPIVVPCVAYSLDLSGLTGSLGPYAITLGGAGQVYSMSEVVTTTTAGTAGTVTGFLRTGSLEYFNAGTTDLTTLDNTQQLLLQANSYANTAFGTNVSGNTGGVYDLQVVVTRIR